MGELLKIAGSFEPQTKIWGVTKNGSHEMAWGKWMSHGMAHGLSAVENYERILKTKNSEFIESVDNAFAGSRGGLHAAAGASRKT